MVSERKLKRRQTRKTKEKQGRIIHLWDMFENDEISEFEPIARGSLIPGGSPFNTKSVAVDIGLRSRAQSAAFQNDELFENAVSIHNSISTTGNMSSSLNMRDGTFSNAQDDSANLGSTHSCGKFSVTGHDASSWWSSSSSATESSAPSRTGSTRTSEWLSKQVNVNMKDKASSSSGGVESSNWGRDSSNNRRVTASVSSEQFRPSDQFRGSADIRSERNAALNKGEQNPSSWRDERSNNTIAVDTSFTTTGRSASLKWGRDETAKRRHLNGDISLNVRNIDSIKTDTQHVNVINARLNNSPIRFNALERNSHLMPIRQTQRLTSRIKSGSASTSLSSQFVGRRNSERSRTNMLMQPSVVSNTNTMTDTAMSSKSLKGFSLSGRRHLSNKLSDSNSHAVCQSDRTMSTTDRRNPNRGSTHSNSPVMVEQRNPKQPTTEFQNGKLSDILSEKHIEQGNLNATTVTGIIRTSGNQFAVVPTQPNKVQNIVTKVNQTSVMKEQHLETPHISHIPSLSSRSSDELATTSNPTRVGIQPLRSGFILLFRRNTSSSPVDRTSDENVSDASLVKESPASTTSIISIDNPGKRIVQNISRVATT